MERKLAFVTKSAHRVSNIIIRRAYASLSSSIQVKAHEVDRFFSVPTPGITSITLVTTDTWDKWDAFEKEHDNSLWHTSARRCEEELPATLRALGANGSISKVTLPLDNVLNLPVQHSTTPTRSDRGRSPVSIFAIMGMKCSCRDLGLWSLEDVPNVEIMDSHTRLALLKAREFGHENESNKQHWHDFVTMSHDPVFKSFDYTADFHSRDLTSSHKWEGKKKWIDLGPMGAGYARVENVDLDTFSVDFARDLMHNIEWFRTNDWMPHMYEEQKKSGSMIPSVLGEIDEDKIATIVVDRPIDQLSNNVIEKLIRSLRVANDEEVYFTEKSIKKRKKAKED